MRASQLGASPTKSGRNVPRSAAASIMFPAIAITKTSIGASENTV